MRSWRRARPGSRRSRSWRARGPCGRSRTRCQPEAIQLVLAQQLPQVAAAFQQRMGEVHVTAVEGANPFGYIAAAVEGVMGLARSAGLKVPQVPEQDGAS